MNSDDERSSPCAGCDPASPAGHLPPPRCLDLGNGEAMAFGTAAEMAAAASHLARHHPDGVTGPRVGPAFGAILMTWTKRGEESVTRPAI
jgi:hypothetical protein